MNKKLFLAGLFCLVSFALQAQKDDLGLWTSVGMEKRLFRDFDISLEGEFRSRDKLSEVGRWSGSAGVAYKITNWLKAATAYTYISIIITLLKLQTKGMLSLNIGNPNTVSISN